MEKILLLFIIISITGITVESLAQELSIDAPPDVNINDTFTVNVQLSAQETLGASFNLRFDNSVIEALSIDERSFIKQCSPRTHTMIHPVVDNSQGKIEFQDMCLGETISGSGTIAVIRFKSQSTGASDLSLDNAIIFDASGSPIPNVMIKNGKITVKSGTNSNPDALEVNADAQNGTTLQANSQINATLDKNKTSSGDAEINNTKIIDRLLPLNVFIPSTDNIEGEEIEAGVFSAGEPVINASVTYNKIKKYTDSNGKTQFTAVAGSFNVTVTKEGYETKTITITTSEKTPEKEIVNELENETKQTQQVTEENNSLINSKDPGSVSIGSLLVIAAILIMLIFILSLIYKYKK